METPAKIEYHQRIMNSPLSLVFIMFSMVTPGLAIAQNTSITAFSQWSKHTGGPVLEASQEWEHNNIEDGSTIKVNDTYYRFYCAGLTYNNSIWGIGYATATAEGFPKVWKKYARNPLFGNNGADEQAPAAPRVIQMPNGSFRMYYHSWNGKTDIGRMAVASKAGFPNTWTRTKKIILAPDPMSWDNEQIQTQDFIPPWAPTPDGLWHMFYGGYNGKNWRGGHATSVDGINWNKDSANPILPLGNHSWDEQGALPLGWTLIDGTYYITYQGYDGDKWRIGFMTTRDFKHFDRKATPILEEGFSGSWDSSGIEGVDIYNEPSLGRLIMFYVAAHAVNSSQVGNDQYRMGFATFPIANSISKHP